MFSGKKTHAYQGCMCLMKKQNKKQLDCEKLLQFKITAVFLGAITPVFSVT